MTKNLYVGVGGKARRVYQSYIPITGIPGGNRISIYRKNFKMEVKSHGNRKLFSRQGRREETERQL